MLIFSVSYFVITFFTILILQQFKFDVQHSFFDIAGFLGIFPTIISSIFVYFQLPNITNYCRSKSKLILLLLILTFLAWQFYYFILLGSKDIVSFYQELYTYLQGHETLHYYSPRRFWNPGWHARADSGFLLYFNEVLKYIANTALSISVILECKFNKYCKNKHGKMSEIVFERYFNQSNLDKIKNKLEELQTVNQLEFDIEKYFPDTFSAAYIEGFENTRKLSISQLKCMKCNYFCDLYEIYRMVPFSGAKNWKEYLGLKIPYDWQLDKKYAVTKV